MDRLFEGFFWIEPTRPNGQSPFKSTRVVWHYPDDVTSITKAHRDIPHFCFPDLEQISLENPEQHRNEHYVFTLTNQEGQRVYGVCMRGHFRGEGRRYDVKRRARHCLCLITKHRYFSMFKALLLQVHALTLLEQHPGTARKFLDIIFKQSIPDVSLRIGSGSMGDVGSSIIVTQMQLPELCRDFTLSPLKIQSDISIFPLLDVLGVEKFFLLLSAILCEGRVIFVAESVDRLSNFVLAAASMLYPFTWQHILIPLLPSKLKSYASAPMPYLIGVRKYLLPSINKEELGDVIFIDCDTGDCQTCGSVDIKDLIGESGKALKLASESLDRVRAGVANMFFGGSSASNSGLYADNVSGNQTTKDVMSVIIMDLRSTLNAKPGSASLTSVASGLLRSIPVGPNKVSTDEAKVQWEIDAEKTLKDSLLLLFIYLFGELDDLQLNGRQGSGSAFTSSDSRSAFDLQSLWRKRAQDSSNIQQFLNVFQHSQMFERFCDDRIKKINLFKQQQSNSKRAVQSNVWVEEEDIYDLACAEIRYRRVSVTVNAAKQVLATVKQSAWGQSSKSSDGDGSEQRWTGGSFHAATVQYTAFDMAKLSSDSAAAIEDDSSLDWADFSINLSYPAGQALDRICRDANNSSLCSKIMKTIVLRFHGCRAAACRGAAANYCKRAMYALGALLLNGPDSVMSYSLDLIPTLRHFIALGNKFKKEQNRSSSNINAIASNVVQGFNQQGIDFISLNPFIDLRVPAKAVLDLLLDHKKLLVRRKYVCLLRQGAFSYISEGATGKGQKGNRMLAKLDFVDNAGCVAFPFASIHSIAAPVSVQNVPVLQSGVVVLSGLVQARPKDSDANDVDVDVEDEFEDTSNLEADTPTNMAPGSTISADPFFTDPFDAPLQPALGVSRIEAPPLKQEIPTPAVKPVLNIPAVILPPPPGESIPKKPPRTNSTSAITNLIDFDFDSSVSNNSSNQSSSTNFTVFDDRRQCLLADSESKYRVVNKDTGEAMDIRMLVDSGAATLDPVFKASTSNRISSNVQIQSTGARTSQAPVHRPSTDPFNSSLVNWASWGETTPSPANSVNSDPFAFDVFGFNSPTKASNPSRGTNFATQTAGFAPSKQKSDPFADLSKF